MLNIHVDPQHNQIMRLYARALKAKHRPKYSLGIICQWIEGLVNSPLLARSAYGSFALCSKDESDTASRTKPFTGNSWRYFFGALLRFRYHFYRSNAPYRGGDFIRSLAPDRDSSSPCSQIKIKNVERRDAASV